MRVLEWARAALPLVLVAFAWISSVLNCLAHESDLNAHTIQSTGSISSVSALAPHQALKSVPRTVEIYQFDNSPLGDRQPLLLIHGLIGEFHPLFRWKELAQYLSRDQDFQHRYKIYLARYNSHASLNETTRNFDTALRKMAPAGGLTVVAISMAGTIVRNAMRDPAVDQSISRVITLGAFFRGSPLFCPDWMQQSIRKRHLSPLVRVDRSLGYKLYFAGHKNLLLDYGWDNVDGQRPAARLSQVRADLAVAPNSPDQTPLAAAQMQPGDHKIVVYAAYLHNQYFPHPHGGAHSFLFSPVALFWTTLPAHSRREHPALRFLNQIIAEAVPGTTDTSSVLYPLNDGISPISSSLLLPNDFVAHSDFRNRAVLDNIGTHSYAKKARLFENADHLTFIEGHRRIRSSADISDVLSMTEKPRSMFAWILKDLLE